MNVKRHHPRPRTRGFDLERHVGPRERSYLSGCAGKPRYTSEAAARAGIGLQLGHPALDAYPCDHCNGWHMTELRPKGQRKATPPVYVLAFVCASCRIRHPAVAASERDWTPDRRRVALLQLEPLAIKDGWSIGVDDDHCPTCAAARGLDTLANPTPKRAA